MLIGQQKNKNEKNTKKNSNECGCLGKGMRKQNLCVGGG